MPPQTSSPKAKTLRVMTVSVVAAFTLAACSKNYDSADASNNDAVIAGQALYAENCAACHGANLEGQPNWKVRNKDGVLPAPPHDDSGHTWHHPDELLFNYTKKGGAEIAPQGFKSGMPSFAKTLSDSDIWATLSFIKSRWSLEAQIKQTRMNKKN